MTIDEVYKRCKAEFKEKERGAWIASKILLVVALVHLILAIISIVNLANAVQLKPQNLICIPINITLWSIGLELGNKPNKTASELIKEGKHESIPSDYPYSLVYTGLPYPFDRTDLPPAKDYVPTVAEPVAPAPVAVEPVPVAVEPVPVTVEPVPVTVEPVPVAVAPAPVAVDPVPVAVEPVPVAVEPAPVASPATNPSVKIIKYCTHCGMDMKEDQIICESCGVTCINNRVGVYTYTESTEQSYSERLPEIAPIAAEEKSASVAVAPAPVAVEPVPVAVEPVPVAVEPVPVAVEPVPVAVEPVPVEPSYLERLSGIAPVAPIPVEEKPAPIARPAQKTNTKRAKYCRHCGWDMDYDQEICENCGKEYNGPYVYAEQEEKPDNQSYLERLSNIAPVAPIPVEEKSIPAPAVVNPVPVASTPVAPTPAAVQPELETLFCQQCGNQMMIPRNSGTVKITCMKCGYGFIHVN